MILGLTEMEKEICDALHADLSRSPNATIFCEITPCLFAAKHDLKHLKKFMKDIPEETELVFAPARTSIRYEPLGVVGVIGSWNYPIFTIFKPLI